MVSQEAFDGDLKLYESHRPCLGNYSGEHLYLGRAIIT